MFLTTASSSKTTEPKRKNARSKFIWRKSSYASKPPLNPIRKEKLGELEVSTQALVATFSQQGVVVKMGSLKSDTSSQKEVIIERKILS